MVLDQHFWVDTVGLSLIAVIAWFLRQAWAGNTDALKELAAELHQVGAKLAAHDTAIALNEERTKRFDLERREDRKSIQDIWNVMAKKGIVGQVRRTDPHHE